MGRIMYLLNEDGFTLAELLVGIIVVSVFMLGTFVFQHNMLAFSRQGDTRVEMQRQGTLALEYIIRGVREASDIDISPGEGGVDNGITVTTPDAVFDYWSVEDAGDRQDNMYMDQGTGEELLVGDYTQGGFSIKVDDLVFTDNYPTTNVININFTLNLLDLGSSPAETLETMNFSAQVQPRNRE